MSKVVIIGAGISGLIANYVFSGIPGVDTTLVSRGFTYKNHVNTEFNAGPLRYVGTRSKVLMDMLEDFEIPSSTYELRGGVLGIDGAVYDFPADVGDMPQAEQAAVLATPWPDVEGLKPQRGIAADFVSLAQELAMFARPVRGEMVKINAADQDVCIETDDGFQCLDYDLLVLTSPCDENEASGFELGYDVSIERVSLFDVRTLTFSS